MINKSQAHQAKKGDLGKWKFYLFWGAVCHVASTTDSMYKNRNLKEMKNVIGVAGGADKVDAIRAVLNGQYLDVLITDEITANYDVVKMLAGS